MREHDMLCVFLTFYHVISVRDVTINVDNSDRISNNTHPRTFK